jgi:pyruvate,orthophosphate dikinase
MRGGRIAQELCICTALDLSVLKIGVGTTACQGAGAGYLTFSSSEAVNWAKQGRPMILCKKEITEHDYDAVQGSAAVFTMFGGSQSLSAMIARHLGKPSVVGAGTCHCGTDCKCGPTCSCNVSAAAAGGMSSPGECSCCMSLDTKSQSLRCYDGNAIMAGELVTVDGTSGTIYRGQLPTIKDLNDQNFRILRNWACRYKRMGIMSSVSDVVRLLFAISWWHLILCLQESAALSLNLGAEGIGHWGAERIFLHPDNINFLRKLFLLPADADRAATLELLFRVTQNSFGQLFRALPQQLICTRLYDPSLMDLFPSFGMGTFAADIHHLADEMGLDREFCMKRIMDICEQNPPNSLIGSRLLHAFPDFADVQIRAIIGELVESCLSVVCKSCWLCTGAACFSNLEGTTVDLELLLPWLANDEEVASFIKRVHLIAGEKFAELSCRIPYKIGIMLESPRSCLRLQDFLNKNVVDFAVIDTNTLTSMVFGYGTVESPKYLVS